MCLIKLNFYDFIQVGSNETTPTREAKRKPLVPPRPPGRQAKPHLLTPDQSECSMQRESIDGEYVCPNGFVDFRTFRVQSCSREREVVQLINQEIAPPPNTATVRDSKGYLTLYMTPDN